MAYAYSLASPSPLALKVVTGNQIKTSPSVAVADLSRRALDKRLKVLLLTILLLFLTSVLYKF